MSPLPPYSNCHPPILDTPAALHHHHLYDSCPPPQASAILLCTHHSPHPTLTHPQASAIFLYTHRGITANLVSRSRPDCPIFAFTNNEGLKQRLNLRWGITPFRMDLVQVCVYMCVCVSAWCVRACVGGEGWGGGTIMLLHAPPSATAM